MQYDTNLVARQALRDATHISGGTRTEAFAEEVVEGVLECFDDGEAPVVVEDRLAEIAECAVPIYTREIAEIAADAPELITYEAELSEGGSAERAIIAALYEVAFAVAHYAYREMRDDFIGNEQDYS